MIPKSHPRYESLTIREKLVKGFRDNIVVSEGLIAHGRGEAFDYLIGEKTIDPANHAEKVAAAYLLSAKKPVISVNGNTAALVGREIVELSKIIPAKIEVNLFHHGEERMEKISKLLKSFGAEKIFGGEANARIKNLESSRGLCSKEGIYIGDVVLVPLEDGDRAEALTDMGKIVIAIDLNPLSRTAQTASVTIVDNLTRAIDNMIGWVRNLKDRDDLRKTINSFDNKKNLSEVLNYIIDKNWKR